jgi:Glutathione S-transferase, N-terminal domain
MAAELILHHYNFSNYSEKVRLVLGLKGLSRRSVDIPPVLPKYDTTQYWQGGNDADIHDRRWR